MPHVSLSNFAKIYGPLIYLKIGTQSLVVASSSKAAIEILKTHDVALSARHVPHIVPLERSELSNLSMGWSLECGNRWKYLRRICRNELFSGKAIESQACIRERKVTELVNYIDRTIAQRGEMVNIGDVVFTSIYNTLGNILLSRDVFSDGGEMKKFVATTMKQTGMPNISDLYPFLSGFDLQGIKKNAIELSRKINNTWALDIKDRREKKHSSHQDFLDVMIHNDFTDDAINQLLQELFTARTDSSSSTIEWAMAELIKNPRSMEKLIQELDKEIEES